MASLVDGSFVFTVLDGENSLYFVRGENPLCIYHYKKLGLYVYASTKEILLKALARVKFIRGKSEEINTELGDILRITSEGICDRSKFENLSLMEDYSMNRAFTARSYSPRRNYGFHFLTEKPVTKEEQEYYEDLCDMAALWGYEAENVDSWLEEGYLLEDIEDMLYCGQYW